jgi:hypothetical protein
LNSNWRHITFYVARLVGCAVVAVPIFYLQLSGRPLSSHSGLGWTTSSRCLGWPYCHGMRVISQRWGSPTPDEVVLRDYDSQALVINIGVLVLATAGVWLAVGRLRLMMPRFQFFLSDLLILFVVAAGVCAFLKCDRDDRWVPAFLEAIKAGKSPPPHNPPISEAPACLFWPALAGVGAAIYAMVVWSVLACKLVCRAIWRDPAAERTPGQHGP